MKNFALLVVSLFPYFSLAQNSDQSPWLEKGEIQVGVGFGSSFGGYTGLSARTTPYLQYFIKDRWAVRLEGQYEAYGFKREGYLGEEFKRPQYLGVGVSTQYYFLKTARLSFFGQAGYSHGRYRTNVYDYSNSYPQTIRTVRSNFDRFSLGVGAQYRLGDRWMINALVERQTTTRFKGGATGVSVGVSFRIK